MNAGTNQARSGGGQPTPPHRYGSKNRPCGTKLTVIVQFLIVHLLLGFRKRRDIEFYEEDPLIQRVPGWKV